MEYKKNKIDTLKQKLSLGFFKITTNSFFREIRVTGQENIPQNAPVIICGNHNNQFIDALLMGATAGRSVKFIMAAASMRRHIHGAIGRFLGCIPVERPRDLAKQGKGTIISIKDGVLKGKDTEFTNQVRKGTQIIIGIIQDQLKVNEVISDTELRFSIDTDEKPYENINEKYKICPDIDQSELFGYVWSALNKKQCIGIFPEGISHDSSDFMPLKAGVCIMALGAMQKFHQKVYIVPCGLNYFKGDRFRSKVSIQYGQAFEIPFELVDLYNNNKREAISALLLEIENRLRSVVYRAKTSADLQAILQAKRLYFSSYNKRLNPQEINILTNRFNSAYVAAQAHPEMVKLLNDCKEYNNTMIRLKLTDGETVARYKHGILMTLFATIYSICNIIFCSVLAFPGLLLNGPIGLVLRYLAETARKKEAIGWPSPCLDIVASYKVSFGLIIIPVTFWLYYLVFFFFLKNFIFSPQQIKLIYCIEIGFIVLYPIYAFLMLRLFDDIKKHYKAIRARIRFLHSNTELEETERRIENEIKDIVNIHCRSKKENFEDFPIEQEEQQQQPGNEIDSANKQVLSPRDKFIFKLNKIKQAFSYPVQKIQEKLSLRLISDSTMQEVYRYLDKNRTSTNSSELETDE